VERPVINGKKVVVVLPAYNAEKTLAQTVNEIDRELVDDIWVVDDDSTDDTWEVARALDLNVIRHEENLGYGGNQKTCYRVALEHGADVVVMLHPDYQYSPKLLVSLAAMIAYEEYDFVIGSRILAQNPIEGGMPRWKYVSNRLLTLVENLLVQFKLSEYHSGYRAYSSRMLRNINLDANSNDFVFDNQVIVQALAAGFKIGELSCPTRYDQDSSSINLRRSIRYGLGVLQTAAQYRLQKMNLAEYPFLQRRWDASDERADSPLHHEEVDAVAPVREDDAALVAPVAEEPLR
jgi:glycosyltransferase involved in cell wall biosynthesis